MSGPLPARGPAPRHTTRRRFLGSLACAAGAWAWAPRLFAADGGPPAARAPRVRGPNVLFIAVDDLRPELGCYGSARAISPHIDRLAASGTVFDRAYCQQAVCSPSRTSLLTGCRPDTTRVYDLETHFRKTLPNVVTLPQHFMRNGYRAQGLSKIFHGSLNDPASWSVPWWRPASPQYRLNESAEGLTVPAAIPGTKVPGGRRGRPYECADVPDRAYADGETADRAIAVLREAAKSPFFLAVGFLKPHLPFVAPKRYWDLYDRAALALAADRAAPKGFPPLAGTNWGELRAYAGVPAGGPVPDDLARTLIHGYLACVSYIDAQVGRVLAELDALGLRKDTVVVLWGDHGWKLGEHGMWCKHTNFEWDTRSTLIVSAPGQKAAGAHTRALTEFVDIYPGLCDLCGLDKPAHLEGTSLAPLLDEPSRPWKKAAFSQYPRGAGVMGTSIRTDRFRYTEWRQRPGGKVQAVELYDHLEDGGEDRNVADDPARAGVRAELAAALKAGWRAALP